MLFKLQEMLFEPTREASLSFSKLKEENFYWKCSLHYMESKNLIILFVYEKIISKFSDFRLNKLIIMIILAYFF